MRPLTGDGGTAWPIGLVIDSTAQLPPARVAEFSEALDGLLRIVDLSVTVDDVDRPDSAWSAEELCSAMRAGSAVATSQPAQEAFARAYSELAESGARAIVVLTISAGFSGTHAAARAAADAFAGEGAAASVGDAADGTDEGGAGAETDAVEIRIVDSRTTSAGLAGAAEVALAGIRARVPLERIAGEVADWCAEETRTFFIPEDLEYLRRGGRIGRAASLIGRALSITPVLGVREGVVEPLARVRTQPKAEERLVRLVTESCAEFREMDASQHVVIVVQHPEADVESAGPSVTRVLGLLRAAHDADVIDAECEVRTAILSTVITAHVGPGAVGVTVQTQP